MQEDSKTPKPMPGYILVKPEEKKVKTKGGIYLPENVGKSPQTGKVIATGEPMTTHYGTVLGCPVQDGDEVFYKMWGGNDISLDGVEYQFLKFDDILAVIK